MRRTAVLALASLTLSMTTALAAGSQAALADETLSIPMSSFADIVVDDTHGHVFLSGGNGTSSIQVRDLAGAAVTTVANEPGASQMALSADGSTLYVALVNGDAVSAISTSTLTETARYATGASTCPATVAVTGGKVWFGYGCGGASGNIGVIDPAAVDPAPLVTLGKSSGWYYAPGLQSSAAKPGMLVAGEFGISPATLRVLDVSSGDVVVVASNQPGSNLGDFALSPDGSHVVTASGSPYEHPSFSTTDLSADGVYSSTDYPNAVAMVGDLVAAGVNGIYADDIYIHHADGGNVRSYEIGGSGNSNGGLHTAGLAFNADGSVLYAVTGATPYGGSLALHVLHDPGKSVSAMTLTKPASASINHPYVISGRLTAGDGIPAGTVVSVKRSSSYGVATLPSETTGSEGSFTIPDNVGHRGTFTYTASWAGDATHAGSSASVAVAVTGATPSVSITTSSGPYAYGAKPVVVAHLGSTHSRVLTLYAQQYGGSRFKIKSGTVDAHGNLSVAYTLTRRTVFTAAFDGDDLYQPRVVAKTLLSKARVTIGASGSYGTSGSYHLVHVGSTPILDVLVAPNNYGGCVDFVAQHYSNGSWVTGTSLSCNPIESNGHSYATYHTNAPSGTRIRIRPTFRGTTRNVATVGPWLYLQYR